MGHSPQERQGINVHLYPSPLRFESRIFRITEAIAGAAFFDAVVAVGVLQPGLAPVEQVGRTRSLRRLRLRVPLPSAARPLFRLLRLLEWSCRVVWEFRGENIACVNAHSLPVLPASVLLARLHRAKLVYDTHELETETGQARGYRRLAGRVVERWLIKKADLVSVVNTQIAQVYREMYPGLVPVVIRNIPPMRTVVPAKNHELRQRLGIGDHEVVCIYQGLLSHGRGIDVLIRSFVTAPSGYHLVLVGHGEMAERVRQATAIFKNIHMLDSVLPDELPEVSAAADVGLSIIEAASMSYYLSLPNKVFEYVNAGIPVLASAFPAMSELVEGMGLGWTVPPTSFAVAEWMRSTTRDQIRHAKTRVLAAREALDWRKEAALLETTYRQRLFGGVGLSRS